MMHRLMQGDIYDPHFIEDETRYRDWLSTRFAIVPPAMDSRKKIFFKRTALWRLGQRLRQMYKASKAPIVQDKTGDWLVQFRKVRSEASLLDGLPSLDSGLDEYERNITAIVQESRRRSLRIVLMTQPSIWKTEMSEHERSLLWMGWRSEGNYYTTKALMTAMGSYNRRLLDTCLKLDVECVDLASRLPRTTDVFYDDMHFNEEGARSVAAELVSYFRSRAPFA
jgi:hypothetical protein